MESTKVFATLALAAATGKKIHSLGVAENDKKAMRLGRELQLCGKYASKRYPAEKFTPWRILAIYDSVSALINGPEDPEKILSMLLAGLSDIVPGCDTRRRVQIEDIISSAQACLDMYPMADDDHESAFERYERWVAA